MVLRFCLIVLACAALSAQEQPAEQATRMFEDPMTNRMVNYKIDAKLDPQLKVVRATQLIEWRNMTAHETKVLKFHLFQNAFKNTRSAMAQMAPARMLKYIGDEPEAWGFIEVEKLSYAIAETNFNLHFTDPAAAPPRDQFKDGLNDFQVGIDKRYPHDETTAGLFFTKPIRRGQSVWIRTEFTVKLPEPGVSRSGVNDQYYLFGQWFPKLGVFENGDWICNPYGPYGEFYANFGVYQVTLDLPSNYEVGATGIPLYDKVFEGRRLVQFLAEDVIDFAWTTSPDFIKYQDRVGETEIVLLMQPDHDRLTKRHMDAAKASLKYFSELLGPFPYPRITIVDPPDDGYDTSGMEYPMFVTAGTYTLLPGDKFIETVIAHEIAHNYFQSTLASNEFAYPWMDEGFAEYLDTRFLEYNDPPYGYYYNLLGLKLTSKQSTRRSYLRGINRPAPNRPADQFESYADYGFGAYTKPAMLLHTLEGVIGQSKMDQLLAAYYERYKFRHPQPEDFFKVVREFAGPQHLAWFRQGLEQAAWINYRVMYMGSTKLDEDRGFGHQFTIGDFNKQQLPEVKEVASKNTYQIRVKLQRQGELAIPSSVLLSFADGSQETFPLPLEETTHYIQLERPARLESATVDPENRIAIDRNWLDNSTQQTTNHKPVRNFLETWLHALQTAMVFAGP